MNDFKLSLTMLTREFIRLLISGHNARTMPDWPGREGIDTWQEASVNVNILEHWLTFSVDEISRRVLAPRAQSMLEKLQGWEIRRTQMLERDGTAEQCTLQEYAGWKVRGTLKEVERLFYTEQVLRFSVGFVGKKREEMG